MNQIRSDIALVLFAAFAMLFSSHPAASQNRNAEAFKNAPRPGFYFQGQSVQPVRAGRLVFFGQGSEFRAAIADQLYFTGQSEKIPATEIQLFAYVERADSEKFKGNTVPRFEVETQEYDRTPYRLTRDFEGMVTRPPGARAVISGTGFGKDPVYVDNFIVLEIADYPPVLFGAAAPVFAGGAAIERIGTNAHLNLPGDLDVTNFFVAGVPTYVRAYALDYGGVGVTSPVYLVFLDQFETVGGD